MRKCWAVLIAGALAGVCGGKTGGWADPAGFFTDQEIRTTVLRPGLQWIEAAGTRDGRQIRSQILAVDLDAGRLALEAFVGGPVLHPQSGQYVRRTTVSRILSDHGALAAVNVAFFDIGSTQASHGLVVRDGVLLREPRADRPSLLVARDGRVALGSAGGSMRVVSGERRRPLAGVNRPVLAGDEVVAYLPPWSRSPGTGADFSRDANALEILVGPVELVPGAAGGGAAALVGPVLGMHRDGRQIEIPAGHVVLSATASAAPFFRDTRVGGEIRVEWELDGLPDGWASAEVAHAVSGGPILLRDGELVGGGGNFHTTRHPRTAIGIDRGGRRVLLVVVDGRSPASAGMDLGMLAGYLRHLGAHDALNVDGGGSSAIGALIEGKARILNRPSDGRERAFPTGFGVVERR